MTSIETKPDAGDAIEAMSLPEIEAELAGYQPGTQAMVERSDAHIARRQALWRRLDALTRSGGGGQR